MPYIAPEVILEAKRMDLLTYLRTYEPQQLVRYSRNSYCTKEHDSLKISNGKWMWWSRGIGGRTALDYLIKVKEMSFLEAVETIMGQSAVTVPVYEEVAEKKEVPLLLPNKNKTTDVIEQYLFKRGIDYEIINYCIANELIMESLPYHNIVFIGYDEHHTAKYAGYRATNNSRIMGDCSGSKKEYSFQLMNGNSDEVHLFECPIDLLSYATLYKLNGGNWKGLNLVSLAGVYAPKDKLSESKIPKALEHILSNHKNIKRIVLHLDNDIAGRNATTALSLVVPDEIEVVDDPPPMGKDFNDFLCIRLKIKQPNERNYER